MSDSNSPMLAGLERLEPGLPRTFTAIPNDLLTRLVIATEAIRDHLTSKKALDHSNTQVQSATENLSDDVPHPRREAPNANAENEVDIKQVSVVATFHNEEEPSGWLSVEQIRVYTVTCSRHELKWELTRVALRCFKAHLMFLSGDRTIIEKAQSLVEEILHPMVHLQSALTERGEGNMLKARNLFYNLFELVREFQKALDEKYEGLFPKVGQLSRTLSNAWYRTLGPFMFSDGYAGCLEYIVNTILPEMEAVMDAVREELATFEEKTSDDWLSTQKYDVLEERCIEHRKHISLTTGSMGPLNTWPKSEKHLRNWKIKWSERKFFSVWDTMSDEMGNLIAHYEVIGGDEEVIKSAKLVQRILRNPIIRLQQLLYSSPFRIQVRMAELRDDLENLWVAASVFKKSLYHQKHAFYFREVKTWVSYLRTGFFMTHAFLESNELDACLVYICDDLFVNLEKTMVGAVEHHNRVRITGVESDQKDDSAGNVVQELKIFGEKSLPTFLANEMERDTTRFVNITTIATFFSSVTATTLQFTYQSLADESSEPLRGVVNLFWFVSLVFSVSSGVSSLLGLTWRKSSIYDSHKPPELIRMWFDKAPMVCLIIAAVTFVIGLNLFAYLSAQPHYVSLATNVFTGLHSTCLLAVTSWLIYQLKHESFWARWIRIGWKPVVAITNWFGKMRKKWTRTIRDWLRIPRRWVSIRIIRFQQNVHLQRNIYWALAFDNRVAQLNNDIYWIRDFPDPYLPSRVVRFIAYPIRKTWGRAAKILYFIVHFVKTSVYTLLHMPNEGLNVEAGERKIEEEERTDEKEETKDSHVERVERAYRLALQKLFGEAALVESIMENVKTWQKEGRYDTEDSEKYIKRKLWGYPDLVRRFHRDVRPILVDSQNKRTEIVNEDHIDEEGYEEHEAHTLEEGVDDLSPGPSGKRSKDDKGKGRMLASSADIYCTENLDSASRSVRAEVQAQAHTQPPEAQDEVNATIVSIEDSGPGGVPEMRGRIDGTNSAEEPPLAAEEQKEAGDLE